MFRYISSYNRWTLQCGTYRWSWRLNALEHNVHAYFLSSLWISLCLASALELLNVFWHIRHWIIVLLPALAVADELTPVLSARGLFRCMPLGFVPDGDKVSLWFSTSSLLPNHTTHYTHTHETSVSSSVQSTVSASDVINNKTTKNKTRNSRLDQGKCWQFQTITATIPSLNWHKGCSGIC